MILPDVNILIYAHNEADQRFERASSWFQQLMSSDERTCFCRETIYGFIRISTNLRAGPRPISLDLAFSIVDGWLSASNALFLDPAPGHYDLLRRIALDADAKGPLFTDAILATYAISNNATIASSDRDFRLFEGLRWIDPLAG
jgi:toxin-antitoxin system PIN domain toxin